MFKLGRNPSAPDAVRFKLTDFFALPALPTPPQVFGHSLGLYWGQLGNDVVGDCVLAGAAHEHMLWTREWATKPAPFDAPTVIKQYSEITGYVPGDESTDRGTDMGTAASYRRRTGILDVNGSRHKIDAYLAMNPRHLDEMVQAAYLFGAVGVGVRMPLSAGKQFDQQKPWRIVLGSKVVGGHYIVLCGRNSNGHLLAITWGRLQAIDPLWMRRYCDECLAYVSLEHLSAQGYTKEGLDLNKLHQALRQLA